MNGLFRKLSALRARFDTARDVYTWRKQLVPLRALASDVPSRRVLFCDLMKSPATAKVESLMAGALRAKGYRPVILLERPDWVAEGIFRAAVSDAQFAYREKGVTPEDIQSARQKAEAILAPATSLQSIVELEIDGFRIGRNVQSTVLRQFRVGRLDEDDLSHRAAAKDILVQSLATKAFVERMMAEQRPDVAIFVERGYTPAGEVFDGCIVNGVDVVQWCGAPQDDCLIYRRYDAATRSEHPLALSHAMWQHLLQMRWSEADERGVIARIAANYRSGAWYNRQQLQEGKDIIAAHDVRRQLGLDPGKKTAVVFCHILYDATFFYGTSLFDDYEQWMVETVRAAIANPALNWIVKVHPVNVWRSKMDGAELVQLETQVLNKHFGQLPQHVKIMPADTPINTFSLFGVTDYGLTVRGTIGMELPCFGIPIVIAGTGRYSGRGFTIEPPSRAEYMRCLATLQEVRRLTEEEIRKARLHYFGALNLRPVPMDAFKLTFDTKPGSGKTQQDVVLQRVPDEGVFDTKDIGRFVDWVSSGRAPELLAGDI